MINLSFEDLQQYTFESGFDSEICVLFNGHKYFFYLKYNENYNKIVCFSNGAIDPAKKKPPLYQRSTWKDEFKTSCLFIDDPTLHNTGLKIGWGQGTHDSFALEPIAKVVEVILERLNYPVEATTFYGSSAGGYMSMYLGILVRGAKVIVNNPQTNVLNYIEKSVNQMLDVAYAGFSKEQVIDEFLYRLSIVKAFEQHQYIPPILYMQNRASVVDMKDHVKPFRDALEHLDLDTHNVQYYFYKHPKEGHSPLSKDQTIRLIHHNI
ncbi:YqiA/YcfP family alpha/beta fold hydrolase [Macrococcus equi]|uniref:YqiA/YcfP family alpha/beta fold hydrolase n=1 Tax=Macrococcus equi TaxID=3395462 RepID=UPI0039BE2FC0